MTDPDFPSRDFLIGDLHVNLGTASVTRGDQMIALPKLSFDLLVTLARVAPNLVTLDELMDRVWPGLTVEPDTVSQRVKLTRQALGDDPRSPRYIAGVRGRGYRLIAAVSFPSDQVPATPVIAGAPDSPPVPPASVPVPGSTRKPWRWLGLAVGVCGVVASTVVVRFPGLNDGAVTSPAEYQPLTDVSDAATSPVLSPDGRMLAFIRGSRPGFPGQGQIWLKLLPDGEPVRLTDTADPAFAPAFTPDGARVAYTVIPRNGHDLWDTWTVPITGGVPTRLLPNASALTFIAPRQVMYSEFKTGIHLGIATAMNDRSGQRDIYLPAHERAMAHFSYLSPDRRSVLVVEMGPDGEFHRCRVVPFAGGSAGVPVGPDGACLSAAWSPDGDWMYLSVLSAGRSHLWRQRFPDGNPQQITSGPGDELTVSVAPDGRSLLTSIGAEQSQLWLHDARGDRRLTTDGIVADPWLSVDAGRAYILLGSILSRSRAFARVDVATGMRETLLPGFDVRSYDVDPAEQRVVFMIERNGEPEIWLAPLDRSTPPKRLVRGGDEPRLGGGRVYFRSLGNLANHLHSINLDGSGETRVLPPPINDFFGASPDGRFVGIFRSTPDGFASCLVSVADHREHQIGKGFYPAGWSRDGRVLFVQSEHPGSDSRGHTAILHVDDGVLPEEPLLPVAQAAEFIPLPLGTLATGPDPSVYVYVKDDPRRNIYRIPLH